MSSGSCQESNAPKGILKALNGLVNPWDVVLSRLHNFLQEGFDMVRGFNADLGATVHDRTPVLGCVDPIGVPSITDAPLAAVTLQAQAFVFRRAGIIVGVWRSKVS